MICEQCRFSVYGLYDDEDFLTLDDDETSYELGVQLTKNFSQNLSSELILSREQLEFQLPEREDKINSAEIRATHTGFQRLRLYCLIRYQERGSDQPINEYQELRAGAGAELTF